MASVVEPEPVASGHFFLSGTGAWMHSGFGSGTGFGSGAEIKWNDKSFDCPNHSITNDNCLGISAASNINKARLCGTIFIWKTVPNVVWIRIRIRIRNWSRNFSKVGLGS
jgi:hypothetical protein